jgi:hypothetical protein
VTARKDDAPAKETGSVTSSSEDRDHTEARGIRRRLQKRANAGDEQVKELVLLGPGVTAVTPALPPLAGDGCWLFCPSASKPPLGD